jgi:hypothetical protein
LVNKELNDEVALAGGVTRIDEWTIGGFTEGATVYSSDEGKLLRGSEKKRQGERPDILSGHLLFPLAKATAPKD